MKTGLLWWRQLLNEIPQQDIRWVTRVFNQVYTDSRWPLKLCMCICEFTAIHSVNLSHSGFKAPENTKTSITFLKSSTVIFIHTVYTVALTCLALVNIFSFKYNTVLQWPQGKCSNLCPEAYCNAKHLPLTHHFLVNKWSRNLEHLRYSSSSTILYQRHRSAWLIISFNPLFLQWSNLCLQSATPHLSS